MSEHSLAFFLDLNRAHATSVRRFDAQLGATHGIGLNDLHLLRALAQAPGHRLRRTDLAQRLGVTASGVTWMLRPLTKRGLLGSEASEQDGRVSFAVLTAAGLELVTDAVPTAARIASEMLGESAGEAELARVMDLLARLS